MTCTIRRADPAYTIRFDAPRDDVLFTSVMLSSPAKPVGAVQCGRRNANPSGYVLHGCGRQISVRRSEPRILDEVQQGQGEAQPSWA